MIYRQIPLW